MVEISFPDAVGFAVPWTITSNGDNRYFLTHELNTGCILVDLNTKIAVAFYNQQPTAEEIEQGVQFQLRNADFKKSLEYRLLLAESIALYNMKPNPLHLDSPFDVFPHIDEEFSAIVECIRKEWGGGIRCSYILFKSSESFDQYHAAVAALAEDNELSQLKARNKLHVLTGCPDARWFDIYVTYLGWLQAYSIDQNKLADIDDATGYGWVSCHTCAFDTSTMYWMYDRGDRMRTLYTEWMKHRDQHPDCDGKLHSV